MVVEIRHGVTGYNRGCRCEVCRAAQRILSQEYHARNREKRRETHRAYAARNSNRNDFEIALQRLTLLPDNTKQCRVCTRVLKFENFEKDKTRPDGLRDKGKHCSNETTSLMKHLGEHWLVQGINEKECYLCFQVATEVDHVYPESCGGPNVLANMLPICGGHNRSKKDQLPLTYFLEMSKDPQSSKVKIEAAVMYFQQVIKPLLELD